MKYSTYCVLFVASMLFGGSETVLSVLKNKELQILKDQNIQNYKKEKFDWVEPIVGSLSYAKTKNFSKSETETTNFAISISQPVFKSGGIYYAIKYANENRNYNIISTRLQEKTLISSVYSLMLNIQKLETNINIQEYQFANAKIDVIRKTEQYESGLIDSSYLDDAMIKQSSISTSIANLQMQLIDLKMQLSNLSDIDDEMKVPRFSLMKEEDFKKANLEIKQAISSQKKSGYIENIRWASYMPTIKLNASYNSSNTNSATNSENEYYNYGLSISMPIFDMGRDNVLELARLDNLKASVNKEQKFKEAQNRYKSTKQRLEIIDNKIIYVENDLNRYRSLFQITQDKLSIGEVTSYDVDIMKNSIKAKEFELVQLQIDKQIELLELYKKIDD